MPRLRNVLALSLVGFAGYWFISSLMVGANLRPALQRLQAAAQSGEPGTSPDGNDAATDTAVRSSGSAAGTPSIGGLRLEASLRVLQARVVGGEGHGGQPPAGRQIASTPPDSQQSLSQPPPGKRAPGPAAGLPDTSAARLVYAIQAELRRVGCYQGAADGEWGPASRQAMRAFVDRLQARLPVDRPDYILLTLLQGHTARACGPACPAGETPDAGGQCRALQVAAVTRSVPVVLPERTTPTAPVPPAASQPAVRSWAEAITAALSTRDPVTVATQPKPAVRPSAEIVKQDDGAVARAAQRQRELQALEKERIANAIRQRDEAAALSARQQAAAVARAANEERARREVAAEERRRIEAAEVRRREAVAQSEAQREAKRLAALQIAAQEIADAAAQRRAETAALAVREVQPPLPTRPRALSRLAAAAPISPRQRIQPVPSPADASSTPPVKVDERPASRTAAALAVSRVIRQRAHQRPRFVARFVPPPSYRVGRLPPRPAERARPLRIRRVAATSRWRRTQGEFLKLERHAP